MNMPPNFIAADDIAGPLLTEQQVATLDLVSEWFIAPSDGYPSVTEADPDGEVLRTVLTALRPILSQISAALDAASGQDLDTYLPQLDDAGSPDFEVLMLVSRARYLSARPVWKVLGYTGRRPSPIEPGEADHYLRDGLLDPAIRRGKVYRATPQ